MNIKITYNWLLEYLDTEASPYDLQKYLSLCGPGVERVDKVGDDYILDIEITTNRVDTASVFGIAQEAQAILTQFGVKAKLKFNPLDSYRFKTLPQPPESKPIKFELLEKDLASRVTVIVISDVTVKPSPDIIAKRVELCGMRAINNVVDISNYVMLALGQPTHTYDYDRIKEHHLKMRSAKKGEVLTTLDGKEIKLPGGDIVIADGSGRLIDLAGIMGGQNTEVHSGTKTVLLFMQTYNQRKIRHTTMTTGQRTLAASYFEKGLDEERVEPALVFGVELLQKYAGGKIASPLHDIYPEPYQDKQVYVRLDHIRKLMGVAIPEKQVTQILKNLGFRVSVDKFDEKLTITIPSWRKDDVEIKEDIVEEVARVYGYHNLPNNIPITTYVRQPPEIERFFRVSQKLKFFLKHIGLHESINYSMVSEKMLTDLEFNPTDTLELANTISEEIKFMRPSLLPSLVRNLKKNSGKQEVLKFFEVAKVYLPRDNDLPEEQNRLGIAINTDFFDLKGIIEALLRELHITNYAFRPSQNSLYLPGAQAALFIADKEVGTFGELKPLYKQNIGLSKNAYLGELECEPLINQFRLLPLYKTAHPYSIIKLDWTFEINSKLNYSKINAVAKVTSTRLNAIEVIALYQQKLTLRFYFSSPERNLTEEEAKKELEKIKHRL